MLDRQGTKSLWIAQFNPTVEEVLARRVRIQEEFYEVTIQRHSITGIVLGEDWKTVLATAPCVPRESRHHREGGAAIIERDVETGVAVYEAWFQNGKWHRADGPATVVRDKSTAVVTKEQWAVNGKLHREGAPAIIYRDHSTGEVTYTKWFVDGIPLPQGQRRQRQREMEAGIAGLDRSEP